jgi:hypothetical protein
VRGEISSGLTTVSVEESVGGGTVRVSVTAQQSPEELRLWADYYEARQRALEIMRRDGTAGAALAQIVAQDTLAHRLMARLKQIHGLN